MSGRVVLGEIIGQIVFSPTPVDEKLTLLHAIADPVEAHVHSLGTALFDSVVDDTSTACVVGLNGSRGLRMAQFSEGNTERRAFFCIVEDTAQFGLGGGGHDSGHDIA